MADRVGRGIEIRRLYKIFGERAVELVDAVKAVSYTHLTLPTIYSV